MIDNQELVVGAILWYDGQDDECSVHSDEYVTFVGESAYNDCSRVRTSKGVLEILNKNLFVPKKESV